MVKFKGGAYLKFLRLGPQKPKTRNDKFDRLCRIIVNKRDGGMCRACAALGRERKATDWHHIWGRNPFKYGISRFDTGHQIMLCHQCHLDCEDPRKDLRITSIPDDAGSRVEISEGDKSVTELFENINPKKDRGL